MCRAGQRRLPTSLSCPSLSEHESLPDPLEVGLAQLSRHAAWPQGAPVPAWWVLAGFELCLPGVGPRSAHSHVGGQVPVCSVTHPAAGLTSTTPCTQPEAAIVTGLRSWKPRQPRLVWTWAGAHPAAGGEGGVGACQLTGWPWEAEGLCSVEALPWSVAGNSQAGRDVQGPEGHLAGPSLGLFSRSLSSVGPHCAGLFPPGARLRLHLDVLSGTPVAIPSYADGLDSLRAGQGPHCLGT